MPSTVIYKSGYPSSTKPVEQSASINALGIVTVSAQFVITPHTTPFQVGQKFSPSFFSCLSGSPVLGLAVESVQFQKQNGLGLAQVQLIGLLRDLKIVKSSEFSLRSFSKTAQFVGSQGTTDVTFSFDYYSESVTWSWAVLTGFGTTVTPPATARFGPSFNRSGQGSITQIVGSGLPPAQTISQLVTVSPVYITTKTEEERGNITTYSATVLAIYQ